MPDLAAVEIRPARPSDLPALARLGAALARDHHAMDPARFFLDEPMEEGYAAWLGKELENTAAVVLAAVLRGRGRGRVVGYAYGRIQARDWNSLRDRCGFAVDLMVDPAARRGGVGKRLVAALVDALAVKGAPRVVLEAAAKNRVAQRLFRSLGFRRTMIEMTREVAAPPLRARSPRAREARVRR